MDGAGTNAAHKTIARAATSHAVINGIRGWDEVGRNDAVGGGRLIGGLHWFWWINLRTA
jgi:hypothetical protein